MKEHSATAPWTRRAGRRRSRRVTPWLLCALASVLALSRSLTAGELPSATDILPSIDAIRFDGSDVLFNDGCRLTGGEWGRWSAPAIPAARPGPRSFTCAAGGAQPSQRAGTTERSQSFVDGDRAWSWSPSYCGEGEAQQGGLFMRDARGATKDFPGVVPKCESFAGAVRVGERIWFASVRPDEYGTYAGSGIVVFDPASGKTVETISLPKGLGEMPILAIARDAARVAVWVTTRSGIGRYSPASRAWEARYLDFRIEPDGGFRLLLSPAPPSTKRLWLAYHLFMYPIADARGFARAWEATQEEVDIPPLKSEGLLPFYAAALARMDSQWGDWDFKILAEHIAQYSGSAAIVAPYLAAIEAGAQSPERRSALLAMKSRLEMGGLEGELDVHCPALLQRLYADTTWYRQAGVQEVCDFVFQHKGYPAKLSEFFVNKEVDGRVDKELVDGCFRAYSMWRGAEAFLPAILKALSIDDSRMLYSGCSVFNHYAAPGFRIPEAMTPVLRARLRAQAYSKSSPDLEKFCRTASYWLANSQTGIDALLEGVRGDPRLLPLAEDVLRTITGQNLAGLEAWQRWWAANRAAFKPSARKFYWDDEG